MNISKETIWHFVCKECKNWWSIANSDSWHPKKLYCPHCGVINRYEENLTGYTPQSPSDGSGRERI